MPNSSRKARVVILGGGIASLSTAMELTRDRNWRDRFESISVYQMGWRLGGKGASGRNAELGQRIEEHGLHVWPGFYDNAFQVMRNCYAELGRPACSPLAAWDDAFKPHRFIVVEEQVGGAWKHWGSETPANGLLPGETTDVPDPWEYVVGGLDLMANWFHRAIGVEQLELPPLSLPQPGLVQSLLAPLENVLNWLGLGSWSTNLHAFRLRRLLNTAVADAAQLSERFMLDVARNLGRLLGPDEAAENRADQDLIVWLVDQAMQWLTSEFGDVAEAADSLRRLWIQLDFARTMLRGAVDDRVFARGFDVLDAEDFISWMRRHGAAQITLDSALMRGLHDFVFAYEGSDPDRPNLAAGVALRLILRLTLTYKGAIMWKMQAGMGDTVFAPLYQVLRDRGVDFYFFHRVKQLEHSGDGQSIARIVLGRQATVAADEYSPLIDVNGLPCWPNRPDYGQLLEGDDLRRRNVNLESIWTDWDDVQEIALTSGPDFDVVVLGTSLAGLTDTCRSLIQSNPKWKAMTDHVKTIKTRAVQLWFTPTLAQLRWPLQSPILTAYQKPFETWADMSQTLQHEDWPNGGAPGNVAYFCGTMPDDGPMPGLGPSPFPEQQTMAVHDAALDWFREHTGPLFPGASDAITGEVDCAQLHDPTAGVGLNRLESQYWKANVEPSERYVQSLAGSTRYRLDPGDSGFANLYLAGDWTLNELNVGCVEAAVISGRRAARAILGSHRVLIEDEDVQHV